MKKKVIGPILCFIFIIAVVFGTLYVIDHKRMDNNEPVLFSTWGAKYTPPLEGYSAVMCSAQSFDGEHLEVTFDDEKHTNKKIAVKDKALIQKLSEISLERIIGVNLVANIPDSVLGELSDYYRVHTTRLLIDYDEYDRYFEITDVSLKNKHCFMAEILDETTTYMIVKPIVVFKSDDIHIPEGANDKLKVEYDTVHYDYLYGIGRKVVVYYEGEPYEDSNGIITIKTEDISTEGYRDFKLEVKASDDKTKRQIVERTLPTDSSGKMWIYGDAALYYYGVEQVEITAQGWSGPLDAWLERGIITLDGIIAKCNRDVADGVIEELVYKDGGSQVYKYPDYTIIKYHTLDGNRDVYIGTPDMDIYIADK